jgi:hypothetical protein
MKLNIAHRFVKGKKQEGGALWTTPSLVISLGDSDEESSFYFHC